MAAGERARLLDRQRPRADDAHLSGEHVEQLRQLVEAGAAQDAAERRHARIVAHLEHRPVHLVQAIQRGALLLGAVSHGAELQHRERMAVEAAPALHVEHRSPDSDQDGERDEQHQRREQDDQDGRQHAIADRLGGQDAGLQLARLVDDVVAVADGLDVGRGGEAPAARVAPAGRPGFPPPRTCRRTRTSARAARRPSAPPRRSLPRRSAPRAPPDRRSSARRGARAVVRTDPPRRPTPRRSAARAPGRAGVPARGPAPPSPPAAARSTG